jgi:hypothetical protein
MAFDPTKPANGTQVNSLEMRNQLNALNARIDDASPIGTLKDYLKGFPGVPALSANWAECNGQVLNDPDSPMDGQTLPDINVAQRFLRGASVSGGTGGSDSHTHPITTQAVNGVTLGSDAYSAPTSDTDAASTLPSYYEVVVIVRVK